MISKAREHNKKYKDDPLYDTDYRIAIIIGTRDEAEVRNPSSMLTEITKLIDENNELEEYDDSGVTKARFKNTFRCNQISYHESSGRVFEVRLLEN